MRWAKTRLRLPSLGRCGIRPTLLFIYRIVPLAYATTAMSGRWPHHSGDGMLHYLALPPLVDASETRSGFAAPF